jgi:ABC-type hemin transport system ATPase subunit
VWIDEHHEELLAQYSGQWIAVEDGRVIASDPDPMALRAKLSEPTYTCVEFVTGKPMVVNL